MTNDAFSTSIGERRGREEGESETKAGFVLMVEAVLALFVISMGLLAGVALISSSLDSAREARSDARLAMFGDGILAGLRAMSLDAASTNGWGTFWDEIESGQIGIAVPAQEMWTPSNSLVTIGGPTVMVLTNFAHHANAETRTPALALRYVLEVEQRLTAGGRTNRAVHLRLWEGAFGGTNAAGGQSFYTEISDQGVLQ